MSRPAVVARLAAIIGDYSGRHIVNANLEQGIYPPAAQRPAELKMPALALVGEFDTPDFRQITALMASRRSWLIRCSCRTPGTWPTWKRRSW